MYLDIVPDLLTWHRLKTSFTHKYFRTGGFLFESLLSALFGGGAQQIPTGATGKDQDVVDIIDDKGREIS